MSTKKPFSINIADLSEVRSKISEVEQIVEERRQDVSRAQQEFAYWQGILDRLHAIAGDKAAPRKAKADREPSSVDLVLKIVNESAVPVRANDIAPRLPELKRDTINWALWQANKRELIQKVDTGLYASLDYVSSGNGQEPFRILEET